MWMLRPEGYGHVLVTCPRSGCGRDEYTSPATERGNYVVSPPPKRRRFVGRISGKVPIFDPTISSLTSAYFNRAISALLSSVSSSRHTYPRDLGLIKTESHVANSGNYHSNGVVAVRIRRRINVSRKTRADAETGLYGYYTAALVCVCVSRLGWRALISAISVRAAAARCSLFERARNLSGRRDAGTRMRYRRLTKERGSQRRYVSISPLLMHLF